VRIESKQGFEIALELTVKAQLAGLKITEIPSYWTDRTAGESRFRMWKWMPNYLRWYWAAMTAPLFVWSVWLASTISGWYYVRRYSSTILLGRPRDGAFRREDELRPAVVVVVRAQRAPHSAAARVLPGPHAHVRGLPLADVVRRCTCSRSSRSR
jgi:hypothetical protein